MAQCGVTQGSAEGLLLATTTETHDLDHSLQTTMQSMRQEVESLDENRLLNTAPEDLKNYLVTKYAVTPITLRQPSASTR